MNRFIIEQSYRKAFGEAPTVVVRAPGRINLIGEHTDYNGGLVLPAAIDRAIWFAAGHALDGHLHFHALDVEETWTGRLDDFQKSTTSWVNYLLGVISEGQKDGLRFGGVRLVFGGDVPIGAGLSSSAAMESGMIFLLNELFGLGLEKMDMVRLAQRGENNFVGMPCGIMDMFASVMGRRNCAIRLDCRSLQYDYVPFDADDVALVLCDSGVKHTLVDSEYKTRRAECAQGVEQLRTFFPHVPTLRDVTPPMLISQKNNLSEIVYRRCNYVIAEIQRVELACEALSNNNWAALGKLMTATHKGLRHEYEVSCPELDFLFERATGQASVLGARLMGGGFGGCTVNLVRKDETGVFLKNMKSAFQAKYGRALVCHEVVLVDGAGLG